MAEQRWQAQRTIRLALADPSTVFRLGVRTIIGDAGEFELSEAASLDELDDVLSDGPQPDLALVDLDLPPSGAAEAIALLRRSDVAPIVWARRSRLSPSTVFELVRAGGMGVLTKDISPSGLLRALRGTVSGQAALARETASLLIEGMQKACVADGATRAVRSLSSREIQVLELVADGRANREIAVHLDISEFTVKRHIQNILRKIGVRSRWEASASYLAQRRETETPTRLFSSRPDADAAG